MASVVYMEAVHGGGRVQDASASFEGTPAQILAGVKADLERTASNEAMEYIYSRVRLMLKHNPKGETRRFKYNNGGYIDVIEVTP